MLVYFLIQIIRKDSVASMNNQNPYGQQPQQMQQPQMQMPKAPKAPLFNNDLLGIISCAAGVASLGLGLLSAILCNSVYGMTTINLASGSKVVPGPSPIFGFIMNIVALLLGAVAVLLALKVGNDRIRSGAPRGTIATLGLVFGLAGACICIVALFFTSCSMCSNCSMKSR